LKTIGVLSDTHLSSGDDLSVMRAVSENALVDANIILHAGDIHDLALLEAIFFPRPVFAVAGNMDSTITCGELPAVRIVDIEKVRIALIHGHSLPQPVHRSLLKEFSDKNAVVFGHTHAPYCKKHHGVLLFNPGSPTQPRGHSHPSVGLLRVEQSSIEGHIINLHPSGESI